MDTFNTFNPEPEVEKSRWFSGPTFTVFLIGLVLGFSVNSFVGGSPSGDNIAEDADTSSEATTVEAISDLGKNTNSDSQLFGSDSRSSGSASLGLVADGENILVVSNQPSGKRVVVSMVSLDMNGWVTVRESINGELGSILGARRFDAGKYFGETIELLRGTEEDKTYFVVLHADDGDKEFDYMRELPVIDKEGDFVSATFLATALLE